MADISILTDSNFAERALSAQKPSLVLLVDIGNGRGAAYKLGRQSALAMEEVAAGRDDVAMFKIDVGGNPDLGTCDNPVTRKMLDAPAFPTLVLFRDGRFVDIYIGAINKDHLEKWLGHQLAKDSVLDKPIQSFGKYAQDFLAKLVDTKNTAIIRNERRLHLAKASADLVAGGLLAGVGGVWLAAPILGHALARLYKTTSEINQQPQPLVQNGLLRFGFNMAAMFGGLSLFFAPVSGTFALGAVSLFGVYLGVTGIAGLVGDIKRFVAVKDPLAQPPPSPSP